MKDFIENYEKKSRKTITKEMVTYLYENIDSAEELKRIYKEVLKEQKKYSNNYYSKICIIINVLKLKKRQNKFLNFPYDIYYMNLPLRGELKTVIEGKEYIIKTVEKEIKYKNICSIHEAMGEEKTKNGKMKLIKKAKKLLNQEKIDLDKAIQWKEQYEKYIINTFGRWSKEYEDYMTTVFDVGFIPTGPNLILDINREHIKCAIQEKLEFLEL